MKSPFQSRNRSTRFFGVALSFGMSLSLFGILTLPAATAAAATVPIAQQPLTVRPAIPPNIVLMLDDSGSMRWDIMPDYSYLADTSQGGLTDSAINGVYYNPALTYTPPPHVDGSLYPNASFAAAPVSGFDSSSPTVDLSLYRGMYDSDLVNYRASGTQYSVAVMKVGATSYNPSSSCPSGWNTSNTFKGYCSFQDNNNQTSSNPANQYYGGGITYNFYDADNDYYYVSRCNSISDVYQFNGSLNNDKCYPGISFFTYTTGPQGSYVTHYVGKNTGDCAAAGLSSSVCDDSDATRQNVANWFAYYHTRILMARSGMLTAFLDLSPDYRFGFGSINGSGASWISSNITTGVFNFSTSTKSNNRLAEVQPFGDGSAGTQKAEFWQWVTGVVDPTGSTPLRGALQGVGKYYQDSQPWSTMPGDPGYVANSTNSPIACRASYTILTTDGFWNGSTPSGIGNADGTGGPSVTGPNAQSYTFNAALPYKDGNSNTLADVAMYYWKNDLQPNIDNEVFPSTEDPAFWQHMVTFTMGLGFSPVNIAPSGTTVDQIFNWANGGGAISGFGWPTPSASNGGSENNIADLAHAAVDGHGAFFSVKSPDAFTAGLKSALKRVSERVGTGASLASNSTQLDTGTVIYQANYYTSKWKGDLKALGVNPLTGSINANPTWTASTALQATAVAGPNGTSTYPNRDIETYNPVTGQFVSFKNSGTTPPSLDAAQLTALGGNAAAQVTMVDYLRGDNTDESLHGGTFRDRDSPLGDIVDSQPVSAGAPNPEEFVGQTFYGTAIDPLTGTSPFHDWAVGTLDPVTSVLTPSAASQRTPLVYVAANDGMLHAFNSATGAEVYAYLPGAVITAGLANLASQDYGNPDAPHQYYNDGQLTIADAYLPSLPQINGSSWHTILVGTTGMGLAEAVYALDITDPANITPLWERSAGDGKPGSDYIGQMVGKPVIAQTSYTPAGGGNPASSTWSVLIGNGYNSAQGVSALLQFDLTTGSLDVHETTDATTGNGLAAPVVWMDNIADGVSTVAYAGDLHGQVWSFQLNDATGSNPTPTSTGTLLFTAVDGGGKVQPITAGMQAGRDSKTGNVWLFFGTGQFLSTSDLTSTDTQTWYGIIVQSSDATLVSKLSLGRGNLVQRTITGQSAANGNILPARTISEQTDPTDMNGKSGWYLDLLAPIGPNNSPVQQGERTIAPIQVYGGLVVGATRIPQVTDICNPSGSGWIMALNPFTGTAPTSNFFDINGDGYVNANDLVDGQVAAGVGFNSLPNAPIFVGGVMETSFDNGATSSILTNPQGVATTRVNWSELVNP